MANYKTGMVFSYEYIQMLDELNKLNQKNKITEVYGSERAAAQYTARPAFRLPEVTHAEFKGYIQELQKLSIDFLYTFNTSVVSKQDMIKEKKKIQKHVESLIDIGVKGFVVTLPFVAMLIREVDTGTKIHVSTIAHIDTITQINIWKEKYDISSVCMNLQKNREINFLERCARYCNENAIKLELIVNEFCGNGSNNGATHCIYRDHCYSLHSLGYSKEEYNIEQYPMSECMASRKDAKQWMKMNYIRPEDIKKYEDIGINNFKITGRTGTQEYLKSVIAAYIEERYEGNLLHLWRHLENIEDAEFSPHIILENNKLNDFVDFWFKHPNHRCSEEVCGITCNYCERYYEKNVI